MLFGATKVAMKVDDRRYYHIVNDVILLFQQAQHIPEPGIP